MCGHRFAKLLNALFPFMLAIGIVDVQQNYPSFWPEKSKMEKYGPVFSVHSVSRKHYANIKQWEYKINKKVRMKSNIGGMRW